MPAPASRIHRIDAPQLEREGVPDEPVERAVVDPTLGGEVADEYVVGQWRLARTDGQRAEAIVSCAEQPSPPRP
jgi:hypothetical protein